jgi:hypothetical protein
MKARIKRTFKGKYYWQYSKYGILWHTHVTWGHMDFYMKKYYDTLEEAVKDATESLIELVRSAQPDTTIKHIDVCIENGIVKVTEK